MNDPVIDRRFVRFGTIDIPSVLFVGGVDLSRISTILSSWCVGQRTKSMNTGGRQPPLAQHYLDSEGNAPELHHTKVENPLRSEPEHHNTT